jgi:hypothetical protein
MRDEGRNIVEVVRQAGNSPSVALDTYGLFDELDGDKRRPAEEVIRKARAKVFRKAVAPLVHPREGGSCLLRERNSAICGAFVEPSSGLEPETPSLPWTCRPQLPAAWGTARGGASGIPRATRAPSRPPARRRRAIRGRSSSGDRARQFRVRGDDPAAVPRWLGSTSRRAR